MPRRERPLDAGESELLQFAADLRKLRELAGSPTYRELSRRAHYSAAALSEAAGGRKMPSLAVTMAYVQACHGDQQEWEARWRETVKQDNNIERAPYVGLEPFQAQDADLFFGRDQLTKELLQLSQERQFTGVFGASGVGKSSVLRAGLIAHTEGPVLLVTPGANPAEEHELKGLSSDTLVVVDQFEELFSLCKDEDSRTEFVEALTRCERVVIGVRADFYGHCARYPKLVDALRGGQVMVGAMSPDELRQAVTEPAARVGATVEPALLARLMSDAVGQPSVLPMLSHALAETWERRRGMTLTLAGYEEAGGLEHAVARTAQEVYSALNAKQRKQAREILLRLIAIGEGTDDTKRRVKVTELGGGSEVLDRLVAARLLTLDGDGVQLAHEALITSWPQLKEWISEDREGLRVHRNLTQAADAWEALDRDPGALYRGVRLELIGEWRAHSHTELNERELAFLKASEAADRETKTAERKRTLRARQVIALLAVLLLVAVTSTVYAFRLEQQRTEQRNIALSLKAVHEAAAMKPLNPALALQINKAAFDLTGLREAQEGMRYEASSDRVLLDAEAEVTALVLTPQQLAFSGHQDGAVFTTNLRDPEPSSLRDPLQQTGSLVVARHTGPVNAIAASIDRGLVVTGGDDGVVKIIDAIGRPSQLGAFQAHEGGVTAMAFRGDVLVTAGQDRLLKFWTGVHDASQKLLRTSDIVPRLRHMAFSKDGRTLAAVTFGRDLSLFEVTDDGDVRELATRSAVATAVAFSADGKMLATAGSEVKLWSVTDPRNPAKLGDDLPAAAAVRLSEDGRRLATANNDGTTTLWNISDPRQPVQSAHLLGDTRPVAAVSLVSNADAVVTGGVDGALRLWQIDGRDRLDRVCERAHPRMTAGDWERFFPGLPFTPPCGG